MRFMVTNSDNSSTHGPHQLAHRFTRSSFLPSFLASLATPASSSFSSLAGSASHLARARLASSRLSAHLVEQPKTRATPSTLCLPASPCRWQSVDGVARVVGLHGLDFRVVDAADVAELTRLVEDEDV